jgi:23S rRNA (guanosine2251-2'-O)-methyltransferase
MADRLFRRNTVLEALRGSRRQLYRLWLQKGLPEKEVAAIVEAARQRGLPIQAADKGQLTAWASDSSHQGVLLEAGPYPYSSIPAILALAAERQQKPFLLLLDLVHGPQNIGSLLRTAECCGVHGVIIQERRAPDVTPHTVTYSAGAAEHLLIAQVTNLAQAIAELKERDIWVVGLDIGERAQTLGQVDLNMALALVVGHEGEGLRRLVRDRCDLLLRLPMRGRVESLNAAVAGSIALYAAWQARGFPG